MFAAPFAEAQFHLYTQTTLKVCLSGNRFHSRVDNAMSTDTQNDIKRTSEG